MVHGLCFRDSLKCAQAAYGEYCAKNRKAVADRIKPLLDLPLN